MKCITRLLLLVVSLTVFSSTISAQGSKQRLSRKQLAEVQAKHIAKEMAMNDTTSRRFIKTFCQFQETEQALKARFAHSQKILDLRQKYYVIYSEFLTQKQIRRVYELERLMMERLSKRSKKANR